MSFKAIKWAIDQELDNATSKLVLVMLANYANDNNECYPSQTHLATRCGCSARSVMIHIKKLVKKRLIYVKQRRNKLKLHNTYKLNIKGEDSSHNTNIYKHKNKNFLAG